jgi:hypothetical protein
MLRFPIAAALLTTRLEDAGADVVVESARLRAAEPSSTTEP